MKYARKQAPAPPPSTFRYRVFSEGNNFGVCESVDCSRPARAFCSACGGEHCRWHIAHSDHS